VVGAGLRVRMEFAVLFGDTAEMVLKGSGCLLQRVLSFLVHVYSIGVGVGADGKVKKLLWARNRPPFAAIDPTVPSDLPPYTASPATTFNLR
jgi:hypothetical protein